MSGRGEDSSLSLRNVVKQFSIRNVGSLMKRGGQKSKGTYEENRRHSFKVNGTKFVVDKRYAFVRPLGTGAYGIVW